METMYECSKGSRGFGKECIGVDGIGWKVNKGEKDVEALRGLLDRIVLILCKDSSSDEKVDTFLPSLSDGRRVDLLKLYEAVRKRGGCKQVCKKGMWDSVAVELDLGFGLKGGLKDIYKKYLYDLDQHVSDILSTEKNADQLMLRAEEVKSNGLANDDLRRKIAGINQFEPDNVDESIIAEGKRKDLGSMIMEFAWKSTHFSKITQSGGAMSDYPVNDKVFNSKTIAVNTGVGSRKRKRGSMHDMLKWVTKVAKHPKKAASEVHQKSNVYFAQSLLARQLLFLKGPEGEKENSEVQNNMKILPSYYDDAACFNNQSMGILRCSKRVSSKAFVGGTDLLPDPEDFSCNSKRHFEMDIEFENVNGLFKPKRSLEDSIDIVCTSPLDTNPSWIDDLPEKHTSVGPEYQAEVPEWTGVITESNSKWLGTKMWPFEEQQNSALVSLITIGRGRPDSCNCKSPGSVTCTRFHIAEKKLELKFELGSLFFLWKFDKMGEDCALCWSSKEESRFMQMVRRNPPSEGKCFWRCAPRYLRRKTRHMVVSYYFNVFVLRRRCYQNRVTPNEIESDDDDTEFKVFGDGNGIEDFSFPERSLLTCSKSKQCTELDIPIC